MNTRKFRPAAAARLALAALAAATLGGVPLALAQDPGQGPPPGFGGGPGGGGRGGQFGGPGGRMPFAVGTVSGVDAANGTVTVQSQFGNGTQQTIRLAQGATVVTQAVVAVSDLKVGDRVQVQGVPTGITASSITAGEMLQMMPGFGGGPGGGPQGNNANGQNRTRGGAAQQAAFASATGKITSVEPLTIALGGGVSLTVELAQSARVTRVTTVGLDSLKVGDRVMASGQAGDDGTFNATTVAVNVEMPGGGFGGPGGGFGGGRGFGGRGGGPGGPPPPPQQ
jgi:hypothetical protein